MFSMTFASEFPFQFCQICMSCSVCICRKTTWSVAMASFLDNESSAYLLPEVGGSASDSVPASVAGFVRFFFLFTST